MDCFWERGQGVEAILVLSRRLYVPLDFTSRRAEQLHRRRCADPILTNNENLHLADRLPAGSQVINLDAGCRSPDKDPNLLLSQRHRFYPAHVSLNGQPA